MSIGRFAGVRVRAHPLLLVLLGVAGAGGQGTAALVMLALLLSHELAHLLAARALDLEVEEVELYPFGGVARAPAVAEAEGSVEAFVAAAGPLNNLFLLAVGQWLEDRRLLDPSLGTLFLEGNMALALFNLLPVLPLDGGRVARGLLAGSAGTVRATRLLARAGELTGASLVVAGILFLLGGAVVPNAFVLGALLHVAARREREAVAWLRASYAWRRRELLSAGVVPIRELAAPAWVPLREVLRCLAPRRYHLVWVLDERHAPLGLLEEGAILAASQRLGPQAALGALCEKADKASPGGSEAG